MIWLHGLVPLLLAFVERVHLRIRHTPNELIMTELSLSALWLWVKPSGGMMVWATGSPSGIAVALLEQWA